MPVTGFPTSSSSPSLTDYLSSAWHTVCYFPASSPAGICITSLIQSVLQTLSAVSAGKKEGLSILAMREERALHISSRRPQDSLLEWET